MNINTSKKQLREFGVLIGIIFPLLIGLIIPIISGHAFKAWTLWIGIPSLVLGITKPKILYYPYRIWMALGDFLGWINGHVILGIVFIFILQPIAYLMRLFGYDPLKLKKTSDLSYREDKKNHRTDLEKIF